MSELNIRDIENGGCSMKITQENIKDADCLAEIRTVAMKPSLEKLGRYDPQRIRKRFLDTFVASDTWKIEMDGKVAGFFVLRDKNDHFYLDHFYIHPIFQNKKLGSVVIEYIVKITETRQLSIKLGALKGSSSNRFYLNHGFKKISEDEFDIYYEPQML